MASYTNLKATCAHLHTIVAEGSLSLKKLMSHMQL